MRILLISPNTLTVPYPVYPLGLDYVAASVSREHEVQIVDLNVVSQDDFYELLAGYQPEIIGITCRNIDNTDAGEPLYFIRQYSEFVRAIKKKSNAVIICGGAGFTILPEEIFRELDADYGIIGEGERFGLLVDALARGQDPGDMPGLLTKNRTKNPPSPWQGTPARVVDNQAEHFNYYLQKGGMLNLQTKRGCSFQCIYCPYPHIEGRKHRFFDPNEIADTALALQKNGAKYFFITDSTFNSDIKHSLRVAAALKRSGVNIPWGAFFAPRKLPCEYFNKMADAGLSHVEFGTEAMSGQMLATYRKPFTIQDVFAAHEQAVKAGLHVAHYFLLGGPGETGETLNKSLDNIEQLKKSVFFFFTGIRIYPHTEIYSIALQEGQIQKNSSLLEPVYYRPKAISLATIEALVEQRANERINWIAGSGGAKAAATVKRMFEKGYSGPLWEYLIR